MNSRIRVIALCLAALAANGARAGERVDKLLAADADGVVAIDNVRGKIRVSGWDRNEVRVEGELDDLAKGMDFAREGKLTRIEIKLPDSEVNSGDGSRLEIHVPRASRVEVKSVSADIEVVEVGAVSLRSVSGTVDVDKVAGEIAVKSVSGNLRIGNGAGEAQLKSVSGNINLDLASRELSLSTVSGDLDLELQEFDRLSVNAVSGDIRVAGNLARGGQAEIKTVSGDCELQLRGALNARISVSTGPGGEIRNALDKTKPESDFVMQEKLDTTIGDGSGSINISTVTGTVRLQGQ